MQHVKKLTPRKHSPRLPCHRRQQLELAGGQLNRASVDGHSHTRDVDLQISHPDDVARLIATVYPAKEGAHPRHQFLRAERFYDVVVSAQLQPDDAVSLVATGSHDHDWDIRCAP